MPRGDLSAWIRTNLSAYTHIDPWIEEVSYSAQVKREGPTSLTPTNPHLAVVRDADRIEALGEVGIRHCLTFCRTKLEKDQDPLPPFIHHAYDKLLRLLLVGFISTKQGRAMAQALHDRLVAFVRVITT